MIERKELSSPLFDEANDAWDAGDAKRAFELFLAAARNGEKYAFNSVGHFFDHGIGVEKDAANAYRWYRRGALRGDLVAYLNLALCFRDAGNFRQSKFWFKKARAMGDGSAAYELGKIYMNQRSGASHRRALCYLSEAVASRYISQDEREEAQALLSKLTGM